MRYQISGEIAQIVRLDFEPGESAWASKGSIMAYSPGLQWHLKVPGGVGGAMRRSLAGEGGPSSGVWASSCSGSPAWARS